MNHPITRHRHDLRRRTLTVQRKVNVTPGMIRVILAGPDLDGFRSLSPDDHVKIFLPGSGEEPERRGYTPRHYDPDAGTLALDFAVHDAGPATRWAVDARPGDTLTVGGPRGSLVIDPSFDWWLLVGDETALPAIGRRVEEMAAGTPVTSLIAVAGPEERQHFATAAQHEALWAHRALSLADDPAPLLAALRNWSWPAGDGFVWIAAETGVARALRSFVTAERSHPPAWTKAAGYWRKGVADTHDNLDS